MAPWEVALLAVLIPLIGLKSFAFYKLMSLGVEVGARRERGR